MQWSGDVELNDGSFQKQYENYLTRLETASSLGLKGGKKGALSDLENVKDDNTILKRFTICRIRLEANYRNIYYVCFQNPMQLTQKKWNEMQTVRRK